MLNTALESIGRKGEISFPLWKRHKMAQDTSFRIQDDDKTKEESGEFLNWTAQMFTQSLDQAPRRWDSFSVEQTTELCTFFPDHLIRLISSKKHFTTFPGYVIFADVSGFTPLCEKYAAYGPSGAYYLTATLNNYIGKMVSLIYSYGGDLIKFAGDAFLAVWELIRTDQMFDGLHTVISCALEIQSSLGHFETDVGVFLRVKLSISDGNFVFTTVGSDMNSTYILYSISLLEVREGEKQCLSGDTILSPSAWSLADPTNYVYEVTKKGFVKVKEILFDPTKIDQRPPKPKRRKVFPLLLKPWNLKERYIRLVKEELGIRRCIRPLILNQELKEEVGTYRRYVIAPIVLQIQKGLPVENLIEMRQVTIMFLHIIPIDMSSAKVTVLVNEVHETVTRIVEQKLGVINKVCLFDKDIMLLVIFGLKGYKGKDEALRALQSGHLVITLVTKFSNVKSVSAGITVGTTYCGVVGHPQRREYTVIGGAVNRAARLMCAFQNVVSCDLAVVFNSRLPPGYFEKTKPVYLKGIGIVGNIYIYLGSAIDSRKAPLLGRYNIVCKYVDMLSKKTPYQCLILRGDPRVGKTRIIQELYDIADAGNWSTVLIYVNQMVSSGSCLIYKLIATIIGDSMKKRMRVLLDLVSKEDVIFLHRFNNLFDVNFALPCDDKEKFTQEEEDRKLQIIFRKILYETVILIDDAEKLDSESWKVLRQLFEIPDLIIVFTFPDAYDIQDVNAREVINNPLAISVVIDCLPEKFIGPLICQMLPADAVPFKLIRVLKKISQGYPGWIQTFLLSYIDSGNLIVTTESDFKVSRNLYLIPDPELIRQEISTSSKKNVNEGDLQVCQFTIKKDSQYEIPPTFDDAIMATFDKLTPFEQLLLKCGAVLGREFKRYALVYMMDFPSESAVCEAIEVLFKMDILGCANVKHKQELIEESGGDLKPVAECDCDTVPISRLAFPKYAFCEFLCFKFSILASTIYQTIPLNQRIQFHKRALSSIKEQIMKCSECIQQEILISIEKRLGSSHSLLTSEPNEMANIKVTLQQLHRSDPYKEIKKKRNISSRRAAIVAIDEKTVSKNKRNFTRRYGKPETQFQLELNALKEMAEKKQDSLYVKVKRERSEDGPSNLQKMLKPVEGSDDTVHQMYVGDVLNIVRVSDILRGSRKKKRLSIGEHEFFKPNVEKCSCHKVGIDVYQKLIYHSRAADMRITELKYLVECAIHHAKYSHYQSAIRLLLEARVLYKTCMVLLLKMKPGTKSDEINESTLKNLQFEKKKIHCYLGKCYLYIGDLSKCMQELSEVISEGRSFHINLIWLRLLLCVVKNKKEFIEKKRTEIALLSFVYTVLSEFYLVMFFYRESAYTGKISVQYAKTIKQLQFMANAYVAILDSCLMLGKLKKCKQIEKEAIDMCLEVYSEKNNWDLLSLGKVFLTVFKGRFYRGELGEAVVIGEALMKVCESFKALDVLMYVYPIIILTLAYQRKVNKIKEVIFKLFQEPMDDANYEIGLRSILIMRLHIYLLIEIGYCFMPPIVLINKIQKIVNPSMIPIDRTYSRILAVYVWMWYIRRKDHTSAKLWQVEQYDNVDLSYENISVTLTMLQAKLISIAYLLDSGGVIDQTMIELLKIRIQSLEWICKNRMPVFLSRFFHLKAYKKILFSSLSTTFNPHGVIPGLRELNKALKYAKLRQNQLELAWIEYSMKVWYSPKIESMPGEVYRKNHFNYEFVEMNNLVKYEHDDILYDLPIPRKLKRRLQITIRLSKYEYGSWHQKLIRRIVWFFNKDERIK